MFNGQVLYDRNMTVKMDKMGDTAYSPQQIPNKLPSGLQGIGMGLGSGGAPVNLQQLGGMGMLSDSLTKRSQNIKPLDKILNCNN